MTTLRRTLAATLLTATALAPMAAVAQDKSLAEQERTLVAVLNAHEFRPTRKALDRIGPDVNQLLVRIAEHPRQRPTVRIRAVSALANYPSSRSSKYLNSLLDERTLKGSPFGTLMRREAMRSLAVAFTDDVVHRIAEFKADEDPQIREGVAIALGDTGSKRALPILNGWLHNEPELFVRLAVDKAIDRIGR